MRGREWRERRGQEIQFKKYYKARLGWVGGWVGGVVEVEQGACLFPFFTKWNNLWWSS